MLAYASLWRARPSIAKCIYRSTSRTRSHSFGTLEPLNILFCGSDEISISCLQALDDERKRDAGTIGSIEVVCKRGKPVGRGLKETRDVPLKNYATGLGLQVHEIPTFTKWTPPTLANSSAKSNIIIAVSFGLFVPPRILNSLLYGGLNVHASLLPDLRGAAPLEWTLLQGRKKSGITLQTLHPEHFDHGIVLAQKTFDLPRDGACGIEELRTFVAPLMADLLVQGLRNGLHKPPLQDQRKSGLVASEAPKVKLDHACVDWRVWSATRILRMQRVLNLWSKCAIAAGLHSHREDRVKWYGLEDVGSVPRGVAGEKLAISPGETVIAHLQEPSGSLTLEYSGNTHILEPNAAKELSSSLMNASGMPAGSRKFGLISSADHKLLFPRKIQMAGGKPMDNHVGLGALQRLTLLPNISPIW